MQELLKLQLTIKKDKNNMKKPAKTIKAKINDNLIVSTDFKKEVTKLVSNDKKILEYTDKRENTSLSMINKSIDEIISLKKQVVVSETIVNKKDYQMRIVKKALLKLNDNSYYKSVIDVAIDYIKSNYTIDFKGTKSISFATLKRVLSEEPTKASIKDKNNEEIKSILDANKSKEVETTKKDLKGKLSTKAQKFYNELSPADYATFKALFRA